MIDQPGESSRASRSRCRSGSIPRKGRGRPKFGVLDCSDLRPQVVPSGKRVSGYAISRTMRPRALRIDGTDIVPPAVLPRPASRQEQDRDVLAVQTMPEIHLQRRSIQYNAPSATLSTTRLGSAATTTGGHVFSSPRCANSLFIM